MGLQASDPAEATTKRWFALGGVLVSSLHLWLLVWLLFAVVVPALLFGWQPLVISSGSMEPVIRAGDVVLAEPAPEGSIAPGDVITYEDPMRGGSLVSHRVLSVEREGLFWTRGDANQVTDSVPVPVGSVLGRGRLLVPFVGLPVLWLTENPLLLAAWSLATVASGYVLVGSRSPFRGAPPREVRRDPGWRRRPVVATGGMIVALVLVASTFDPSAAAFTRTTTSTDNSFVVGAFCSGADSQTVLTSGDTIVVENRPDVNFSGAGELVVRSSMSSNARSLLQFPLPAIPAGCTLTAATLSLNAVAEEAGRTYEIVRAGDAFDVTTVTWDSQPSATGTAASTVTDGVPGATEFDATEPVRELYAGGNHGLVLRDRNERVPAAGKDGPGRSESTYGSEQAPPGEPRLTVYWAP